MRKNNIIFFLVLLLFYKGFSVSLTSFELIAEKVFSSVSSSVVFITTKSVEWDIFSLDVTEIPKGSGSGFIWDKKGHIVTNFHVIEGADDIIVTMKNHKSYKAKVVGVAVSKDIAVLKINAPADSLHPVKLGDSKIMSVGRLVFAIGNPFGLDYTMTSGIISARGREITSSSGQKIYDVLQTDAAINPGNSGGPLLNNNGEVIGINTAIYSPSGAYAGIGFAIPSNTIKRIVPQLIKYGKLIKPGIGAYFLSDEIARYNGLSGAVIVSVKKNSAAEKAGLKGMKRDIFGRLILGDIIVGIDDVEITSYSKYSRVLEEKSIGDKVTLKVKNGKKIRTVKITLEAVN